MPARVLTVFFFCVFGFLNLYCHKSKTDLARIPAPPRESVEGVTRQTLSEYIRSAIKVSSENTPERVQAREELFRRRPEIGALWGNASDDPENADNLHRLAAALTAEKLYSDAFGLYQKIKVIEGDSVVAEVALAGIWDAWKEYGEAQRHAERAVELDPFSSRPLEILGRVFLHRSEVDHALAAFEQALLLAPDDPTLLGNIGYCYLLEGEWAKALPYLERSVLIDGSIVESRNNLGVVLANLGDAAGALEHFAAANGPAAAHNNLGVVYLGNEQWKAAAHEFRSALALAPGYERARANLDEATGNLPGQAMYTIKKFPARQEGIWSVNGRGASFYPLATRELDELSGVAPVLSESNLEEPTVDGSHREGSLVGGATPAESGQRPLPVTDSKFGSQAASRTSGVDAHRRSTRVKEGFEPELLAGARDHGDEPAAMVVAGTREKRSSNPSTSGGGWPTVQKTPSVETKARGRYKVQVFSSPIQEKAETVKKELTSAGMLPVVESADLEGKGIWHRVRLCGFASFRKAIQFAEQVTQSGLIADYWVVEDRVDSPSGGPGPTRPSQEGQVVQNSGSRIATSTSR